MCSENEICFNDFNSRIMNSDKNHLWGGRFSKPTDEFVKIFGASISFDKILALYDIEGSQAHATMLSEVGVLTSKELKQISEGLEQIKHEITNNQFEWSVDLEDVHMNIESRLTEICGDPGKKLHTGRSRNDQIATDIRLYLRDKVRNITTEIERLLNALLDLADQEKETIMPGFTHLQAAQPVSFGHHLLAYFEMFKRDHERLQDGYKRINTMPLGSGALAGTSYPINRERTAEILGFEMHLSRFSEELILWSSVQFDFISLPDSFCTGSSIMPQKKNPDVPELVRGKAGRVNGNLVALLTLMKGQPLAYNKDNQEDKEPLFDTVETLHACLRVFSDMVPTIKAKKENMYHSALKGHTTATDLADYLVKKGMTFRDAHEIVGQAVSHAINQNKDLSELSLKELKVFNSSIENDVFDAISLEGSVNVRNHLGGTSPKQVSLAIKAARKSIK